MRALSRRLLVLEQRDRPVPVPDVRVFYDDELVSCAVHARCGVEKQTGRHHAGVLKLTFIEAGRG